MAFYVIDRWKGGVTINGYSPPCDTLAHTGAFSILIPAGCTIRKAYLRAGRCWTISSVFPITPLTVTLTDTTSFTSFNYTFDLSNQVTPDFLTGYGGNSAVHVIDITTDIATIPTANNYTLTVPAQTISSTSWRYSDFSLVVEFDNAAMQVCNYCMYLNDVSMSASTLQYALSFVIPIDNSVPVGVGLFDGYICNLIADGSRIKINATVLGTIGDTAVPNGGCNNANYAPPRGNFSYSNSTLIALANCNNGQTMGGRDGLSDIKAIILNGATFFTLNFDAINPPDFSNNLWAIDICYHDTQPFPYECQKPDSVITSLITNNSARATWTYPTLCGGVLGDVNFQYRVASTATWTVVPLSGVGQYDMTGLTNLTNYEYQIVSTNCAGAVCEPSNIYTFTTL